LPRREKQPFGTRHRNGRGYYHNNHLPGMFRDDLSRILVLAQRDKLGMPQPVSFGQFPEFEFARGALCWGKARRSLEVLQCAAPDFWWLPRPLFIFLLFDGRGGGSKTISRLIARPFPLSFCANGFQHSEQISYSLPSISFCRQSLASPQRSQIIMDFPRNLVATVCSSP
jgi:hypothetical protein